MRIIAGTYRSRILKSPKGLSLRPTSDRLRETLFNVLGAGVQGARFMDIFAGTGAIGIEALSRGAAEAVFIEKHAPTAALIRGNLESLGIRTGATVIPLDAAHGLEKLKEKSKANGSTYDYVFLDPPYDETEECKSSLRFLESASFLASDAIVIAEHRRNLDLPAKIGTLVKVRVLKQGDAVLSFFRRVPSDVERKASTE